MTPARIAELIQPYIHPAHPPDADWPHVCGQLAKYLVLLQKWNARTNLTAIRNPEEIVQRHFGESIFAAAHIDPNCKTLLDFGSGAGFPGIPSQLVHPNLQVTLAESQNKKAAFLMEVCRELSLPTKIFPARVQTLPKTTTFDAVVLRAVDNMEAALKEAARRTRKQLILLTALHFHEAPVNFQLVNQIPLPDSGYGCANLYESHSQMFHVEHS